VQDAQCGLFAATGNHRQNGFAFFNEENRFSRLALGIDSLLAVESKRSFTLDDVLEVA